LIKTKKVSLKIDYLQIFSKRRVGAMYQQASPFGDKRQFVGIIPIP